jgi:aspartyl-tRNA(Asn)/glutamyl-tRNA(Gln) amidotransferase subunit A
MTRTPPNPLAGRSLAQYASDLRGGAVTAAATVRGYLARIAALDPALSAFTAVQTDPALATAEAIDRLLRAGTDLGPMMGVPIVLKDLYSVDGMETTGGSRMRIGDLVPPEGPVVQALRRAGCVILGKTRTSEFALGGVNYTHPLPHNPWDMAVHRMPGGSSSGSAVAQAAGMCAVALGTDTGGSVRMPAALCGTVGHKFSFGALSLDGIFPLSPTLDSPGVLGNTVADVAAVAALLLGQPVPPTRHLRSLRLGLPGPLFFDDLDPVVDTAIKGAIEALRSAGAELVPIDIGPADDWVRAFAGIVPVELAAILGRDRITEQAEVLDPVARFRLQGGLDQPALEYLWARQRQRELEASTHAATRGLDAWLLPTSPIVASPAGECKTVDDAGRWNGRALRNTRPGNLFGQCGVSIPLPVPAGTLPVGLQIVGRNGDDLAVLSVAAAIEALLGPGRAPAL